MYSFALPHFSALYCLIEIFSYHHTKQPSSLKTSSTSNYLLINAIAMSLIKFDYFAIGTTAAAIAIKFEVKFCTLNFLVFKSLSLLL